VVIRAIIGLPVLLLAALALGCGGSALPTTTATPDPSVTPITEPITQPTGVPATLVPSPTATQAPIPTTPPAGEAANGGHSNDDALQEALINQGKILFETTAGGVGCALCHGLDGKGKPEFASPPNRGATADMIWNALENRPQMSFIVLSNDEVRAVAAYLEVLATEP